MKNIFILFVFSLLLINCNNDKPKPESENQGSSQGEISSSIDSIKTNVTDELPSECVIDIAKLDSSVWVSKEFTINYIMDNILPPVDSATIQLLLSCGVLDESRRTEEIEGEEYEYEVNYSYYNIYELEHYYILILLEEIVEGPEYSFIAVSITPETNKVIDSKYMLSVWMDQYEANFDIEFQPDQKLAVTKNTKYHYSTEILDSLEVTNIFCYYELDQNGKLIETMIEDQYYKCALLDYEKGLVNGQGQRENVLYVILPAFDIKMNDFYYGEEFPGSDYELFTTDVSDRQGNILLEYNTGGIYGASGSPFKNLLEIIPRDIDFTISKVELQYTTTLLFSEDGSGGVFTLPEAEESTSDWVEQENVDEYLYKTLSKREMEKFKNPMDEQSINAAENYINSQEGNPGYYEDAIDAKLRITYTSGGNERTIILQFYFEHGD